jgi:translation initiation factor IF-2
MLGLLEPTLREKVLGQAEVRQLFRVPKVGVVAGCYVSDGKVTRNSQLRLLRDNVVVFTGQVGSLKRFKDDVSEVKQGYECGIGIANFNDLKEGDVIESFIMEKVAPESL